MIWVVQKFYQTLFIYQMAYGFKIWLKRKTKASTYASTYKSFQLVAVFGSSKTLPGRRGIRQVTELELPVNIY